MHTQKVCFELETLFRPTNQRPDEEFDLRSSERY